MNKKILTKTIATLLVITMTIANIALLATESYALNTNLEAQGTSTNNENVQFDAYFKDEKGNKTHTITSDINEETKIYMYVSVTEGYLKETKITLDNPNFILIADNVKYDEIDNIDTSSNTITLNKIRNGEAVELAIPIKAIKSEKISVDLFNKETGISINGLLVKSNSKTTQITKTIKVNQKWQGEAEINLEQGIIKYISYKQEEKEGIVLQAKIKVNLVNNNLPIEKTKIQTIIPKINSNSPKNIYVTSDSTKSTNGKDGSYFNEANWSKKEDTIQIEVSNPVNNNEIVWKKDTIDEYIITYIYGEEAYKTIEETPAQIKLETAVEITAYNLETTKITKENKKEGTLEQKVNEMIMFNIESQETIEKGYMYTKANETKYQETIEVDVANKELANKITIEELEDKYITEEKEYTSNTQYKTTKINKENFIKILGQEGYIKIYNQNNQQIAEINKNSETKENDYIINYDTEITSIKIETSAPQAIGKLKIQNIKAITTENTYEKETIKSFQELKTNIIGTVNYNEEEIIKEEKQSISTLKEPTTQAETILNNTILSTVVENKNIEIRTVLKTSDITCKLYKNPSIKIQLPDYIENVSFNEAAKILFTDELEIETATYNPEAKTIEVQLKGEQTKYNDVSVAEGPTLALNVNITLNQLTPSTTGKIITTIINEEEKLEKATQINYQAPVGMVTVNKISGYNENDEASSVSGQESTGKIETNSDAKTAIVTLTLINNNNNVCKNIEILGRTPFEGNKSITTGEDLGSTFTTEVISKIIAKEGIESKDIEVYYSTNENATKNLQDETNRWVLEPENLSEVKSYLIILKDYEMATGTLLTFEYNTKIPEGLRNDEKTYGTFVVYYDNVIENSSSNVETQEQEQGNTIQNNITIENNTISQENIIGQNNTTTQQNTIDQNNTTTSQNTIGQNNTISQENTINQNNTITNNETNKPEENKTNTILIPEQTQAPVVGIGTEASPDIDIILTSNVEDGYYVKEGDIIKYTTTVTNTGTTKLENVEIIIPIPEGTTYRYLQIGHTYAGDEYVLDPNTKEIKITTEIEANKSKTVVFEVEVNELNSEIPKVIAQAKTKIGDYENTSSTITNPIQEGYLQMTLVTYYNSTISYKKGDIITYIGEIKNVNSKEKTNILVRNQLPEGVTYEESDYYLIEDGNKYRTSYNEETNTALWRIDSLQAGESIKVTLKVKVNDSSTSEITNNMYAICDQSAIKEYSNDLTVKIVKESLAIEHSSDVTKEYVDVGDIINYYIKVTNNGTGLASDVKVVDYLPEGMEFQKLVYKLGDYTSDEITSYKTNEIDITRNISSGETFLVTITAKVKELAENAKGTITLTNKISVKSVDTEEVTKEITHKLKVKEQPKDDEEKEIEISGIAWLDESRDGIRDDNEKLLSDITVTLITKEDAKVVKTAKTNKKGEYIFKDVAKGEYIIVFAYDTTKYKITKCQVEGINEGKNSDAALEQTTVLNDGKTIEGAVTNTIKVEENNLYNIDIGLVETMKFDLSLTKTITKVTKQNSEGIKTYDYTGKDKTLAKVEIPSKQANSTNIIVEYTITVKNEGNIPGYAKQIVDYLPTDLKFSSELNKEWYKSTDGNIYTKSLADTIINPGETKEIKLVVTKATTEKTLGTTNNSAEIAESYNDYGLQDIDSTAGNNKTKEDDYGSADILITLNTGTIVMYIGLITSSIAIIGVGAYMIKKKVLGEM